MTLSPPAKLSPPAEKDKWNFNADRVGNWRWTLTTPSREIIRASAEAYKSRGDAVKNARQYGYTGT